MQQATIAKGLLQFGHEVIFVTQDFGQDDEVHTGGFTIYKTFREDSGLPVIRYFHPRLSTLWRALLRADADVYYTRGASFLPSVLALFCRRHGKKFIFACASDTDFMPDKLLIPTFRDKLLYRLGLRQACKVIVQSQHQKTLLQKNFHMEGIVIHNFLDEKSRGGRVSSGEFILWVSTIREIKQPMHFIRLAEAFPSNMFVMIGGMDRFSPGLFEELKERALNVPNLKFLGFQPFHKTEECFDRAKVFVNTSKYEGFPNTFLQAWRRGIPVISYVDPDDLIKKNRLGYAVGSEKEVCDALASFLTNSQFQSASIVEYYKNNHTSKVIREYHSMLEKIL